MKKETELKILSIANLIAGSYFISEENYGMATFTLGISLFLLSLVFLNHSKDN